MTMRYRLRTLLIVLALGPPVLAGVWFAWTWISEDAALATPLLLGFGGYLSIAILAVVLHLRTASNQR
jgi:hypothetical protein